MSFKESASIEDLGVSASSDPNSSHQVMDLGSAQKASNPHPVDVRRNEYVFILSVLIDTPRFDNVCIPVCLSD